MELSSLPYINKWDINKLALYYPQYYPKVLSPQLNTLDMTPNVYQLMYYKGNPHYYFNTLDINKYNVPIITDPNNDYGNPVRGTRPTTQLYFQKEDKRISNPIGGVGNFIGSVILSFNPGVTSDELINNATIENRNIGGVGYTTKNIHARDAMDELNSRTNSNWVNTILSGANMGFGKFKKGKLPKFFLGALAGGALGTLLGGIGTAVALNKGEKEIEWAQILADRQNQFNKNGALDMVVKNDFLKQYGDTRSQLLRYNKGKKVRSGYGLVDAPQTGWVNGGERMIQYSPYGDILSIHDIPRSKHVDSYPAYVDELTEIIPANEMKNYKKGKMPRFKKGTTGYESVIANTPTILAGLGQLASGLYEKPKAVQSYVKNPYGQLAANELNQLHVSDYPILPELYNQYAKSMYAISNSGGLSGGQKTLARLKAMNNLNNNYAKLLLSNQLQNNNYRASYADYITKLGAQEAENRMNALRYDLDYYSKAHAAKQNRIETGIRNMISGGQQIEKDITKNNQFNSIMDLYRLRLNIDLLNTIAQINNMINNSKPR